MQQKSISEIIENMMVEEFDKINKELNKFEQEIELTRTKRLSTEFSKFGGVRE